jgi:hypothetical protein
VHLLRYQGFTKMRESLGFGTLMSSPGVIVRNLKLREEIGKTETPAYVGLAYPQRVGAVQHDPRPYWRRPRRGPNRASRDPRSATELRGCCGSCRDGKEAVLKAIETKPRIEEPASPWPKSALRFASRFVWGALPG